MSLMSCWISESQEVCLYFPLWLHLHLLDFIQVSRLGADNHSTAKAFLQVHKGNNNLLPICLFSVTHCYSHLIIIIFLFSSHYSHLFVSIPHIILECKLGIMLISVFSVRAQGLSNNNSRKFISRA